MKDGKLNVLVVGLGAVGRGICEVIGRKHSLFKKDIDPLDLEEKIDVMHLTHPYTDGFVNEAVGYIRQYDPRLTIIESTVTIGTTEKIFHATGRPIVHSPVSGFHPLGSGIRKFVKVVGGARRKFAVEAQKYYNGLGMTCVIFDSPRETEAAKIMSTTYYGLCRAYAQEMKRLCERYNINFKQAFIDFNTIYSKNFGFPYHRPPLSPTLQDTHCVLANLGLMNAHYPSDMIRFIQESNEKRKKEIKKLPSKAQKKYEEQSYLRRKDVY